jgi:hypothetical protein
MRKDHNFSGWIITIVLAILGFGAGYAYSRLYNGGWLAKWQYLGSLPEQPTRILSLQPIWSKEHAANITIETVSGKLYQYDAVKKLWNEISSIEPTSPYQKCDNLEHASAKRAFSKLTEEVSLCAQIVWSREWFRDTSYYVVLKNNSLWVWNDRSGPDTSISYWAWDPITAICIGWSAVWFIRRIRTQTDKKLAIVFLFLGICTIAVLFWMMRSLSLIASGVTLAALLLLGLFLNKTWCTIGVIALMSMIILLVVKRRKSKGNNKTFQDSDQEV